MAACKMSTQTLMLELDRYDAAYSQPLLAQVTVIGPNAVWLAIGGQPTPFCLMQDAAVAMPRPGASAPAATSLTSSAPASLALASRLSKRYASQVFLSLDLSSLADATTGSASSDRAMLPLEKALLVQLDRILERKRPTATASWNRR